MTKHMRLPVWLALINASLVIAAASPPIIGVARSRAPMFINHSSVPGVATILDGTSLETTETQSNLNLANGGRLVLAPSSSATVHQDRLVLDRGGAELSGSPLYRIETGGFRIGASSPATHILASVQGSGRVHIEAAGGAGEVRNAQGVLVARVQAGTALQLQNTGSSSTQLMGTVHKLDGKYLLTDEVSNVGVELRGANLASLVGKRVGIVGSRVPALAVQADASQVIAVSKAMLAFDGSGPGGPSADSGETPDPSPDPSPSPPPAPSSKKKKAALIIIGGAAVTGGTLGGLWAAGVIGGSSVSQ